MNSESGVISVYSCPESALILIRHSSKPNIAQLYTIKKHSFKLVTAQRYTLLYPGI
jgi:hypothetical protein